ncbi:MAG: iron dependent repressor, metal binding and dimerization domain protein [Bacilli bacterium]|nr:iron dependent repressor, metal binding and dimerization domain protein [Bacilli bacterium]MDD4053345.1 iron dependent repressor, metal binding and dimerization domain protein [Bacilli bacterium]MDD4411008.1 iron dependent repressor, metal binding and dimerization domain protein [Bacilli bacterium]
MEKQEFHTFDKYMKQTDKKMTAAMEDYLEMISRLSKENGFTRVNELANALNVQPPSATMMVQKLSKLKLLKYEKYGLIILEKKGAKLGDFLLKRHQIIEDLLTVLGVDSNTVLEETEKMEHTISNGTLICFNRFISFLEDKPNIKKMIANYKQS